MYAVLEYLAVVGIVWFLFLMLFVALVFWIVLTEGISWLANFGTQVITRLTVRTRPEVNIAWARARIWEKLTSSRVVAEQPDQKRGLSAEQTYMVRVRRQFVTEHGHFRNLVKFLKEQMDE